MKTRPVFIAFGILALIVIVFLFRDNAHTELASIPAIGNLEDRKIATTTFMFVGDVMLDRGVRNAMEKNGAMFPFTQEVKLLIESADISVANLEGTLTNNPSVAQRNNGILRFTADPSRIDVLKEVGFDGFSLANNHTLDFGQEGLEMTRQTVRDAGLFYFGSTLNSSELSTSIDKNSNRYCFVGYHSLFDPKVDAVVDEISRLNSDCAYLVVFAHWGEEYKDYENDAQRNAGRAFVDAGADLVIGHHPHVVQPVEIYKNKAIFYSLGNFLFDQDFSLPTRQGLAVRLELTSDTEIFHLIPTETSRAKIYFPEKEGYQSRMDILLSPLPEQLKVSAEINGEFTLNRGN